MDPFCVSSSLGLLFLNVFVCHYSLRVTSRAEYTHTHKRIIVLLRVKEEEIFQVVVLISLSLKKKEV